VIALALALALNGRRLWKILAIIGVAAAALLATSATVELFRAEDVAVGGFNNLGDRMDSFSAARSTVGIRENVEAFVTRLDLVQAGSFLMEDADVNGLVGFAPYKGLLFVYVPRLIYPEKPVISSASGKVEDMTSFLVASLRGQPWNSNSVSSAAIIYWQFGRVGVVLIGLLSGFAVRRTTGILLHSGSIGQVLLLHFAIFSYLFYSELGVLVRWALLTFVPALVIAACLASENTAAPKRSRIQIGG
jgi:hypothetical protein